MKIISNKDWEYLADADKAGFKNILMMTGGTPVAVVDRMPKNSKEQGFYLIQEIPGIKADDGTADIMGQNELMKGVINRFLKEK